MLRTVLTAICAADLASAIAWPASAQDALALRGRDFAVRQCASCHAVHPDGAASPRADAPTFLSIAVNSPEWLEGVIIRPPHAMLSVSIPREEAGALRAWFMFLRERR